MNNRPLSIAHLVFGLIFLGAAGLWVIGEGTEADAGDIARLIPAVLIGSGVIGLVAIMLNARNGRRSSGPGEPDPAAGAGAASTADDPTTDDTGNAVLDHEEQK